MNPLSSRSKIGRWRWHARILWEPRDLWIGLYWDRPGEHDTERIWKFYVCLIPCLPLLVTRSRLG